MTIGILIAQDVFAVLALIFLDALKIGNTITFSTFLLIFSKAAFLILATFLVSSYILPHLLDTSPSFRSFSLFSLLPGVFLLLLFLFIWGFL